MPIQELPNKENQQNETKFSLSSEEIMLTKTIFNPIATESTSSAADSMEVSTSIDSTSSNTQQLAQLSLKPSGDQKKSTDNNLMIARQIQNENKRKALMLKMEVQKKARELIEKQIKDQKILLEKFEKAKTPEEKNQILSLIKKISEAIEKEKEILNSDGQSAFKPKMESHARVTPAPHYLLKLNNKRLNTTSFLKGGASPKTPNPTPVMLSPSITSQSSYFNFSKVSVDNRPRKLVLSGIKSQNEKTNILNFISALGVKIETVDQIDHESEQESTMSIIINFATRKDAEFVRILFI